MGRQGYTKPVACLLDELDPDEKRLLDIDVLSEINSAIEGIRNRNLDIPLNWVKENGSRLRRLESNLELELRKQQFLEYVRLGEKNDAMKIASEHLAPVASQASSSAANAEGADGQAASGSQGRNTYTLASVQQMMGVLAFTQPQSCGVPEVERLFHADKWLELENLFRQEACKVLGLGESSCLMRMIAAGLSALKTP